MPLQSRSFSDSLLGWECFLHSVKASTACTGTTNRRLDEAFFVLLHQLKHGTGLLTRCPSTTPFGLALGPD